MSSPRLRSAGRVVSMSRLHESVFEITEDSRAARAVASPERDFPAYAQYRGQPRRSCASARRKIAVSQL